MILSVLANISPEAMKENALAYVRVGTPAMQQLHADMPSEAISANEAVSANELRRPN